MLARITQRSEASAFLLPPRLLAESGSTRTVGIEIEFTGTSARRAAAILAEAGGRLEEEDPHAFHVRESPLGDLRVELDVRHVHFRRASRVAFAPPREWAIRLGNLLSPIVPRELVTPPVPMDQLSAVDKLADLLRQSGAGGCGANAFGSLGLHFNVDPPDLEPRTIVAIVKAFLILEPGLRRAGHAGNLLRKAWQPPRFAAPYVRKVLDPNYWPDMDAFTRDFLAASPSRNRSLDLLPLLSHHDDARVRARLPKEKIGRRPVFHYRLPQACLGRSDWSIAPEWNRWVSVERLAADKEALLNLSGEYRRFGNDDAAWSERIAPWLRSAH
jgi:hypothetical protein